MGVSPKENDLLS